MSLSKRSTAREAPQLASSSVLASSHSVLRTPEQTQLFYTDALKAAPLNILAISCRLQELSHVILTALQCSRCYCYFRKGKIGSARTGALFKVTLNLTAYPCQSCLLWSYFTELCLLRAKGSLTSIPLIVRFPLNRLGGEILPPGKGRD